MSKTWPPGASAYRGSHSFHKSHTIIHFMCFSTIILNIAKSTTVNTLDFSALDLILSLFFYCYGCSRYWGRQQVARVSNTQSPRPSVQWINAAKAAYFHVSLNTLKPGLFRSPSSSGARNLHTCDGVYA